MARKAEKNKKVGEKGRILFYSLILAFPLLQFAIFYIGVNMNSFVLAFEKYDFFNGKYDWAGLSNFQSVLANIGGGEKFLGTAFKNSILLFAISTVIGCTLALLFSYYVYKKQYGSKLFKLILFMPFVISSIAMVLVYKYFVESAIPALWETLFSKEIRGLLSNPDTKFGTILFFTVWTGFGVQTLIYSGSMSGISDSVVEAASLDGISQFKEFIYISVPMIFPTISVFLVSSVAGIFVNQMNIFNFYGLSPGDYNVYTVGYYLYRQMALLETSVGDYPYYAAFGLVLTLITAPVTLLFKWVLNKCGPNVD